jgi:type I restriction enzyme, S subunit
MNQDRTSTVTNYQLKEGYKQTELGVIPEDWSISTVGEEFSIQLGKMLDADKNIGTPKPYLGNRSIQWGHIEIDDISLISLTPSDIQRFRLKKGDLLVCEGGESGRAAIWNNQINECYYQKALHRLRPNKGYNVFLMLCFLQRWVSTGFLSDFITQTSIAHLPKEKFEQVPLLVPPLPEQEAIACTLSDIDALIESLDRLLIKKRQIKQGAMQELLRSKDGWVVKRLGEICEIGMGRTPPRLNGAFWGKGYKWLSIADLKSKVVNESKEEITSLAATDMKIIPKGTLLMSFKLSLGRLCFAGCDLFTNEAICSFNQLQANAEFLYYVLGRTDFSLYGKQAVKGYTLNKESLNLIEVKLPSIPEQIEIANILSDMDAEIGSIESKLSKTRQLKQGMMHELLTGRIRLVD